MKRKYTYKLDVESLSDFCLMVIMRCVVSFTHPIQPFLNVVKEVGVKRGLMVIEDDTLRWTPSAVKVWREAAEQRADHLREVGDDQALTSDKKFMRLRREMMAADAKADAKAKKRNKRAS